MTILIVDDDERILRLLQLLLQRRGYQAITATDGVEALAKARRNPPDLIITDILMPVMDGFSLCREWKKDDHLKAIPLIFYTSTYTDDRDREFALGLGAERFLIKPAETEVILQTIREVLHQGPRPVAVAAQSASGMPARLPAAVLEEEAAHLRQYNETLVRKLESKMEQLERTNRKLEQDIAGRKRAEEALRLQTERLQVLHEIDEGMLAARSPEAVAEAALGKLARLVPCHHASVCLFDLELREAAVLAAWSTAEIGLGAGRRFSIAEFGEKLR